MKKKIIISKGKNINTAVGVKKGVGPEGILYKDASNQLEDINIVVEKNVDKVARRERKQFCIFDRYKESDKLSYEAKSIASAVHKHVTDLKRNPENLKNTDVKNFIEGLQQKAKKGVRYNAAAVDQLIEKLLNERFNNEKTKEALRLLLIEAFVEKQSLNPEEKDKIQKNFIAVFKEAYTYEKLKENTVNALVKQNLVVQPNAKTGRMDISENKTSSDRKMNEKNALRSFLQEYATLDDDRRHELRLGLRKLVVLYFYGEAVVRSVDKKGNPLTNEWVDWAKKNSYKEYYVEYKWIEENSTNGTENKRLNVEETREIARRANIESYRKALSVVSANPDDFLRNQEWNCYWLRHISKEVEKFYKNIKQDTDYHRFKRHKISEKVWDGILNFLSIKYIAFGKAVYNFAMNNSSNGYGVVDDDFIDGISSFEYERISAEETLQRECAVYVSFAANHLANATVVLDKVNSDFLVLRKKLSQKNKDEGKKTLSDCAAGKPGTLRNILQFFGGKSSWQDSFIENYNEIDLLNDLKEAIFSLRNASFHYHTENSGNTRFNNEIIGKMFEYECRKMNRIHSNLYSSNNVFSFYPADKIKELMEQLYSSLTNKMTSVPSFYKVFSRPVFPQYIGSLLKKADFSQDDMEKLQSSLYFIFSEIYYNKFIYDSFAVEYLKGYVDGLSTDYKSDKNAKANADFKRVFELYSQGGSLITICSQIMVEYAKKNSGNRRKNSNDEIKTEKGAHYKLILFNGLRDAFKSYIENHYDFLLQPSIIQDGLSKDKFKETYETKQYDGLIETVKRSPELQKWYVVGRLINAKQVNHLMGAFRSYKQYRDEVTRRAKGTGNSLSEDDITIDFENIINVLDVCRILNNNYSHKIDDYFDSEEDYARYLGRFVDFHPDENKSYGEQLRNFCSQKINGRLVEMYYNGSPVMLSNVIKCKLYGTADVISNAEIKKVDYNDIKEFFQLDEKINSYKTSGECQNEEEGNNLIKYQQIKNRIELINIVEYSEIINELQGQLINWVYLSERDQMYFQLGFHYLCLQKFGKGVDGYDKAGSISGAILYQLVAIYTNGISMIEADGKSMNNADAATPSKVSTCCRYSKDILGDKNKLYFAGLEVFRNINDEIFDRDNNFRNYIEHFHYYINQDRSMLSLYSEVFDRFLNYDSKFKKNVPNILRNILLDHHLIINIMFDKEEEKQDEEKEKDEHKDNPNKNKRNKMRADLRIRERNGLISEKGKKKLSGDTQMEFDAKGTTFVEDVKKILEYHA